jgi:Ca2+-transporting ATPase
VAMGERGTDVARESSSLVLLNDDFSTIVEAVKLGRRIYDNLRKAMAYIVSVHIPIAGISLIPVIFNWPIVLHPVHIVFLELIIDPACSVVFESEKAEANVMSRKPRNPKQPLFGRRLLTLSFIQGLFSLAVVASAFKIALVMGQSEGSARALSFVVLVVSNVTLILINRSWTKNIISSLFSSNKAFGWVVGGVVVFMSLVLYIPFLRKVFHFDMLHYEDILIALVAGILSVLWFEILKIICVKKKIDL